MSVEQTVRDFFAALSSYDSESIRRYFKSGMTISVGASPQRVSVAEAVQLVGALHTAMPDSTIAIRNMTVQDEQVVVFTRLTGTHTALLNLVRPGMQPMAEVIMSVVPWGKRVNVSDKFMLTVKGNQIAAMHVESPADDGMSTLLAQLGAATPVL